MWRPFCMQLVGPSQLMPGKYIVDWYFNANNNAKGVFKKARGSRRLVDGQELLELDVNSLVHYWESGLLKSGKLPHPVLKAASAVLRMGNDAVSNGELGCMLCNDDGCDDLLRCEGCISHVHEGCAQSQQELSANGLWWCPACKR